MLRQPDPVGGRCLASLVLVLLFGFTAVLAFAAPPATSVDSFYWQPGVFLSFGKLKQAQKERLLYEVETKLAGFRQQRKSLLIRGELMMKVTPEVEEFQPATVLDQSGMVVIVSNFPNIYYKIGAPEPLLRRTTAFVLQNPQVDRVESILRQAVVLRGEFFGFSQAYLKATSESLEKALAPPAAAGVSPAPSTSSLKRAKKR